MELLKDKLFNGISFEIIKEEYREGYSLPFQLLLRVTNYNDRKKKIEVNLNYISIKYGLKRNWYPSVFIPDNTFYDFALNYEEITQAYDGDRIELQINDGKLASLKLVRECGQWWIAESKERSTYNRNFKSKIEHFEAIDEQFCITLQNFSVKVDDEYSLKVFCEVLSFNGKIPNHDFTINIAIYDSNNDIINTDRERIYADDFKGFQVLTFDFRLDITVDEISKIRIYPS